MPISGKPMERADLWRGVETLALPSDEICAISDLLFLHGETVAFC